MDREPDRPSFVQAWLDDLRDDVARYGAYKVIPIWLIAFMGVSASIAYYVPDDIWSDRSSLLTFYGAILTLNGLLLALSWSGFGKIYETAAAPGFSEYLRSNGVLRTIHFIVNYIHYAQIVALVITGAAIIISLRTDLIPLWHRMTFGSVLTVSLYAIRYAIGSVKIMQDLVWYRAKFDSSAQDSQNPPP